MKNSLSLLMLLLLTGCMSSSGPALKETPYPPAVAGLTAEQLATQTWSRTEGGLRFRQRATFEFRGGAHDMLGMMDFDPQQRTTRLIALNDLGVKLFDFTVTEDHVTENFLLPQLTRFPLFSEAVAISLRRIFLAPEIDPREDQVVYQDDYYRISGFRGEQRVDFYFGGSPVQLLEKQVTGEQNWAVTYSDFQYAPDVAYPGKILLEDRKSGYRLALTIEDVKRIDEPVIRGN